MLVVIACRRTPQGRNPGLELANAFGVGTSQTHQNALTSSAAVTLINHNQTNAHQTQRLTTEQIVTPLQQASALLQQNQLLEAETILRRVIAASPQDSDAYNLLGIVFDQRQDFKAATKEYRTAMRLNPAAVSPLANLVSQRSIALDRQFQS